MSDNQVPWLKFFCSVERLMVGSQIMVPVTVRSNTDAQVTLGHVETFEYRQGEGSHVRFEVVWFAVKDGSGLWGARSPTHESSHVDADITGFLSPVHSITGAFEFASRRGPATIFLQDGKIEYPPPPWADRIQKGV